MKRDLVDELYKTAYKRYAKKYVEEAELIVLK